MGEFFAFCSARCFALVNVTITRGASKRAADNGVFLSLVLTTLIAGGCWLVASIARGFTPINTQGIIWYAAAGLFTAFIGRVFLFASIQELGSIRGSAIKRLSPFFAVLVGVIFLNDPIGMGMMIGMSLIMLSFFILVREAFAKREGDVARPHQHWLKALFNLGFVFGPVSSLGYAIGYLFRKLGLASIPDAFFGTMVGSIVGMIIFCVVAFAKPSYRHAIRATFTSYNPWLWLAGVMTSLGQVAYFLALSYTTISVVALIASMEVFGTMFLSVFIFKQRETLTPQVWAAAMLGIIGTVFIVGW